MKKTLAFGIVLLFLLCNISFTTLSDEDNGSLSGYITDINMNPIDSVKVTITCGDITFKCQSNETGYYYQGNIPIVDCYWNVSVFKLGYKVKQAVIAIDENTTYNFVLSNSDTIYVDDDNVNGPWYGTQESPFKYIKDGIDNAFDGDTVFVYSGTYFENLIVNKSIKLQGEDKNSTIIDGKRTLHTLINIKKDGAQIIGFTLKNTILDSYPPGEGIEIESNFNLISNNIIEDNIYGIFTWDEGRYNNISENLIINNHGDGMRILGGGHNISNNRIENNNVGIDIRSNSNIIWKNEIINNIGSGIRTQADAYHDNIIFGNDFIGNTIYLYGTTVLLHNEINNNSINGKPLVYLEGESNRIIDFEAGHIILVSCNNVQIINQDISNIRAGIEIWGSKNCIVSNSKIHGTYIGILLSSSYNNYINNNSISHNSNGIFIESSNNNDIKNNIFKNNGNGVYLYFMYYIYQSEYNKITFNSFIENNVGVEILDCWHNTYCYNNFIRNKRSIRFSLPMLPTQDNFNFNYWNRPRLLPKIIFGLRIFMIPFPGIAVDWHPAKEPYDIPVPEV